MYYKGNFAPCSRGFRNNNPLNIERTSENWIGAYPETSKSDKRFVQFTDISYGIRAGIKILRTYQYSGCRTVSTIIYRWAPAPENSPETYVRFICNKTGLKPYALLQLRDYFAMIAAMCEYESKCEFTVDEIESIYNQYKLVL